jgi:hypothetical protein
MREAAEIAAGAQVWRRALSIREAEAVRVLAGPVSVGGGACHAASLAKDTRMKTATLPQTERSAVGRVLPGTTIAFDGLNVPGAYVCHWNGRLVRIPERACIPREALHSHARSGAALLVTMISDDPAVPLPDARELAAHFGVSPSF